MSSGPGALHFHVNKNAATPGIFWQKDKPREDPKKFGYKSKKLRHPIRQTDETEALIKMEMAKEEEKKRFNKDNKDFIRKNRQRFKAKGQDQAPPPGTTQIKPGTVTLTQDQLAALLASLGKTTNNGGKDNPLKISFDASNNKIEVEKYESDDSGEDVEIDKYEKRTKDTRDDDVDNDSSEVGIAAFLNGHSKKESKEKPKRASNTNSRDRPRSREKPKLSRDEPRPEVSHAEPTQHSSFPQDLPTQTRLSWADAKKEAGVANVPDVVPWKHLTVGEKKRLQWARERAEVAEEYNPWGRPGAGAPMRKQEEEAKTPPRVEATHNVWSQNTAPSNVDAEKKRQQEEIENEIEKLRREIKETEERKKREEERIERAVKEKRKQMDKEERNAEDKEVERGRSEKRDRRNKAQKHTEEKKKANDKDDGDQHKDDQVQIVIIKKKRDKSKNKDEEDGVKVEEREGEDREKSDNNKEKRNKREKDNNESRMDGANEKHTEIVNRDRGRTNDRDLKEDAGKGSRAAGATSTISTKAAYTGMIRNLGPEDATELSKKEIEKRKWLEELNKQREEQRMRKQQERERDRAEIHDQWADRFVYHKTTEQISPRYPQGDRGGQQGREAPAPAPALGRAPEPATDTSAPPAAMRSSMVIGAGTLNEHRYDNKKAEEKRRWLEELDRQREEQRQAKASRKARERQEEDGTWADRYPVDHQKLLKTSEVVHHAAVSPREEYGVTTQRISSAPHATSTIPPPANQSDEPTTFLRGQGAYIDPVTRKEQEEKRRVQLEYQAQVKAQIEEKERKKREERERKRREDMEEERKLQMERDHQNHQAEMEQRKHREREELRQKQIAVLKNAMEEAQEKAVEEKNIRRIHHLQEGGHDVSQLKATYDEPVSRMSHRSKSRGLPSIAGHEPEGVTPRIKDFELSAIPGLGGNDMGRNNASHAAAAATHSSPPYAVDNIQSRSNYDQAMDHRNVRASYTKDPYVEDRVLTPSRFRNPSKPRDLPDSPRREFGTQTLELKDLQAILQSLPDEVQIEYKMKVEEALKEKERDRERDRHASRKVRTQNVEERDPREATKNVREAKSKERPPAKVNERPQWNQRKRKTVVKNSEKDPYYHQKKEEADLRRQRRERKLLYLQELNQEKIPNHTRSPTRNRDVSPEGPKQVGERGRKAAPTRKIGNEKTFAVDKNRDTSPNILSLIPADEKKSRSKSPKTTGRSSPPIPAVRHRTAATDDPDHDAYSYANHYLRSSQTDSKYGDAMVPVGDEFVPFMRTTEILDPSKADDPVAVSRENSRMERARRAYHETHHPADKGRKLNVYQDREREAALKASQNPLMNPGLVTDHPTARQDMILQQLSSLKKTLMQRQRELEDYMSPTDFHEETARA